MLKQINQVPGREIIIREVPFPKGIVDLARVPARNNDFVVPELGKGRTTAKGTAVLCAPAITGTPFQRLQRCDRRALFFHHTPPGVTKQHLPPF